jgi:hypothetical protein
VLPQSMTFACLLRATGWNCVFFARFEHARAIVSALELENA